jgi:hypothetical protein
MIANFDRVEFDKRFADTRHGYRAAADARKRT